MQKNYEVIRFIQQSADFHIVMDSTMGESLSEYIVQNPEIEKDKLLDWIVQIVKEMVCVERASGMSEYHYLMPFCVVIKQNQQIALLNLKTRSNQKRLERILANPGIKTFFPEDGSYNDIYSFGKTLQYIFAHTDLYPSLTRREEKKIKKIISKCLKSNQKKTYQSFEEIFLDISNLKNKKSIIFKLIIGILLAILGIMLFLKVAFYQRDEDNSDSYLSAGLTYFITLNDYKKSEELFSKVRNSSIARYYQEMAAYMQGDSTLSEKEMEKMLKEFEEETNGNLCYEQKYCLLKVYDKLSTESADENVIRLSKEILESPDWYKDEEEVREILEQAR